MPGARQRKMSEEFVADLFEDSYPEDEKPELRTWFCTKCNKEFVDPEDYPWAFLPRDLEREVRLYWLSITEPLCSSCAIAAGIPPIDEG